MQPYSIDKLDELTTMIILRVLPPIVLLIFLNSAVYADGNNTAQMNTSQMSFPDLLSEDFDQDEFDEEFDEEEFVVYDPLEPMNRVFFEFNDLFYEWLLKPVGDGYTWLIPRELRVSFGNFFYNLAMPVRLINTTLQGDFVDSGRVLSRFLINSTLGVWGLVDVADQQWGIKRRRADFGQTLGRWGVGEGVFFCWPLIGPSNMRDSLGLAVDIYSHPLPYLQDESIVNYSYYATTRLNKYSLNPNLYDDLKEMSIDPYIASRQAYYEFRRAFIARRE